MKEISSGNFGILIAYILPGFVAIWGISGVWPTALSCTTSTEPCALLPSLVTFLNTAIAAIAAGMALSAIRFVVIDTVHGITGLKPPHPNGVKLQQHLGAVKTVVEHHYRYYQFHANMLIAGLLSYGVHLYKAHALIGLPDVLLVILAVIFWIAARDNLKKYYANLETIFEAE